MKKDLTKVEGTYSSLLSENIQIINKAFEDTKYNTESFRKLVNDIIEPAKDTQAKRLFKLNLGRKRNKYEIMFYVNDSWLCGSGLGLNQSRGRYQ